MIKQELSGYADGKTLKGDEIVGWLGEIYGKLLLGGTLVSDDEEHDFEVGDWRISVKTRKGFGSGWKRTSAIPKIEGEDCPTHLMFVHLNNDYTIRSIWLFPWKCLLENGRFVEHVVRGEHRSYYFTINPERDRDYLIFGE